MTWNFEDWSTGSRVIAVSLRQHVNVNNSVTSKSILIKIGMDLDQYVGNISCEFHPNWLENKGTGSVFLRPNYSLKSSNSIWLGKSGLASLFFICFGQGSEYMFFWYQSRPTKKNFEDWSRGSRVTNFPVQMPQSQILR